jgi:TRAP transporter TAXI family solute receptor
MVRVATLVLLALLAACGQAPDEQQLRRDLESRLSAAFEDSVVLDRLQRQGRMEQLDGSRIVHFRARLRVERPLDLGQWGGPNAQLLAGVLGAGSGGISGLTQGGNQPGDQLTVFGTLPYARAGGAWVAAAAPGPVAGQVTGPPGQLAGADRLLALLAETLRAAPANTRPPGARVIEEELEQAKRTIEARIARLQAGFPRAAGTPGGAYHRLASALAADAQARGVRIVILPSAGSVENLQLLRAGTASLAFAQADVAALAHLGQGPFAGTGPHESLRALLALFPEQLHVVVRADDPAQELQALAGRVAALGLPGSGTRVTAGEVLQAAGITVREPDNQAALDPRAALAALAAGRVDVVFLVGAAPFPPLVEASGTARLRLLPIDPDLAGRLAGAGIVQLAIPAAAYPGQSVPVPTLAVPALLLGDASLTEREVLRIGQAVLGRVGEREREPLALMVSQGTAGIGTAVPLHPAARQISGAR